MRRYHKYLLVLTGMALFAMAGAEGGTAYGEEPYGPGYAVNKMTEQKNDELGTDGTGGAAETAGATDPLEDAEVDRIIYVLGGEGADVTVSYRTRGDDGIWVEQFSVPGKYGNHGSTADKREGDGKTPLGTYRLTMAFGILENPGSVLPYRQLTEYDYWVDDPDSQFYNRLVDSRETGIRWKSAERMIRVKPFYNYGLALSYNEECIPGKGSAIFLHCTKEGDTGTSGCVEIPEEYMKKLVMEVDENTRITIASGTGR